MIPLTSCLNGNALHQVEILGTLLSGEAAAASKFYDACRENPRTELDVGRLKIHHFMGKPWKTHVFPYKRWGSNQFLGIF